MKKYLLSIALLILLTGCSTSHLEYVGKNNWASAMSKSALTSGDLSYKTTYFLVKNALMNDYRENHMKVMILLAKFIENPNNNLIPGENSVTDALCALIELCAYEGRNTNSKESIKYWLSSAYYSYKYLFDKKINTIPTALNSLELAAQVRFYNYSVSQIYSYFADNKISLEKSHEYPLIIGSANLTPVISDLLWSYSKFTGYINGWEYFPLNLQSHSYVSGLGVPILGLQDYVPGTNKNLALISMVYPFTFLIRFENFDIEKEPIRSIPEFFDSFKDEYTVIDNREIPLSKDFSLALAKCVDSYNKISGIKYMFNPAAMVEIQGLYFLSPYNPDKIPVIMTHGLMSTPATWLEMLNTLLSNQTIRENYQFWLYTYPTGQPIFYSEYQFRTAVMNAHKEYDPESKNFNFNHMVLIGHSMGGILSRLAVQDSEGNNFAKTVLGVNNLDELKLNDKEKEYLNNIGVFKPLPFVKCVILLATPNRGSEMATLTFSRIGSYFITLPGIITTESSNLINKVAVATHISRDTNPIPTGIDSLKPSSKYLEKSLNLPYKSDLEIHTIIGNQYKAGEKSGSDGVVPYSSAHLDNAQSELVVKSDHSVQKTPEAIKEVTRILLEYLDKIKAQNEGI